MHLEDLIYVIVCDLNSIILNKGSTIVYAIERLAEKVKNEKLNIKFIPTSFQSRQLLIKHSLPITDLEMINQSIGNILDNTLMMMTQLLNSCVDL